ncbi:MAG: hypothetical protein L0Y78_02465 [candidate division NC10 bacterium]|nr:hypothetical protein [candidate division NC10 bacterium]
MDLKVPLLFLYVTSWAAVTGGVWALFERAETVASPETKAVISRWLRNLDPAGTVSSWPATFAAVFDHVFGEHHLSWRCFGRSCVVSLLSVAILLAVWGALRPAEFLAFIKTDNPRATQGFFFGFVILNLIPDYLSLLESRYVLRWMVRAHSTFRILAFLALDLVATVAIAVVSLVCFRGLIVLIDPPGIRMLPLSEGLSRYLRSASILSVAASGFVSPGVSFYSTLFTSVWVWLYALSGAAVRVSEHMGIGLNRMRGLLDIENKPLRCLGFVSIIFVTLVYLLAALIL